MHMYARVILYITMAGTKCIASLSVKIKGSDQINITIASDVSMLWKRIIFDNITANVMLRENFVKNGFRVLKSLCNITVLESTSYNYIYISYMRQR